MTVDGATATRGDGSPLAQTRGKDTASAADTTPRSRNSNDTGRHDSSSVIGRFVVRGKLGAGAFGAVYRAYDPHLDREVALKVPHAAVLDNPKRVERFLREAKAAANLRHPHIVPVFDAGTDSGRHYIASAFIDGTKLAEAVESSDGGLELERAARLVRELAEALAYAHEQGIVHRDVKPDNVMLDKQDRVHLMDFGLAVKQDAESRLTNDGAVMGTPTYMSPEQAKGETDKVGPASDQYACGVVLYELLTGQTPFTGPIPMVLHNQIHTEPESPRKLRRAVPSDLETVCLKAMSKRVEDRYASCQELADDLRRWLVGEPITARQAGRFERAVRWVRKKPAVAGLVAAGVAATVLLAVAVGFAMLAGTATIARRQAEKSEADAIAARAAEEEQRKLAEERRDAAEGARERIASEQKKTAEARDEAVKQKNVAEVAKGVAEKAQAAEAEARKQVEQAREKLAVFEYGSTMRVAHQEWREGNLWEMRAMLDRTDPKFWNWEWHYLNRLIDGSLLTLMGHTNEVMTASFSPDGSRVVTSSLDKTARVWDARTGKEQVVLNGHSGVYSAGFSPDGSRVVTAGDKGATVWDAKTGKEMLTLTGHTRLFSASFSPDGTRIVTGGGLPKKPGEAKVWVAKTGKELLTLKGHTGEVHCASFSPDQALVVTAGMDGVARVWDAKTGKELLVLKGHAGGVHCASFSPDGSRVVTGSLDKTARVWEARTGKEQVVLKGHGDRVYSAGFSPDGSRIVTGSWDHTVRVWDAQTGSELLVLKGHTNWVRSASFSPDGSLIITAGKDSTVKVWDARNDVGVFDLKGETYGVRFASFSPDGRQIVTGEYQKARVWDAVTGKEVLTLKGSSSYMTASFRPDGRQIVTGEYQKARVWDAVTGKEVLELKGQTGGVRTASFSPDGTRIITGDSNTARVWDAVTGEEVLSLNQQGREVGTASFSPDGTRIITGDSNTARVWDAVTGKEVLTLKGHTREVLCVGFSPDGTRIVTASSDGLAKVWDARNGAELLTLKHVYDTYSASFSPDGSRVVTAGGDYKRPGTIRVWDAKTGAELLSLKGHSNVVRSVSFSADGTRIVTASDDKTTKIWDAGPKAANPPPPVKK